MDREVTCPSCGRKLRLPPDGGGGSFRCPACASVIGPRASSGDPQRAWQELADPGSGPEGIVTQRQFNSDAASSAEESAPEDHGPEFADEAEARQNLAALKQVMPQEPPAYPRGGMLTFQGASFLLFGGAMAVVGGGIVGYVGTGALMSGTGRLVHEALHFTLVFAVLWYGATFALVGWLSAKITVWMGQGGNNRDIASAVAIALAATGLAVLLTWMGSGDFLKYLLHAWSAGLEISWDAWFILALNILGSILAFWLAFRTARNMSRGAWCNACAQIMRERPLPGTHLTGGRAVLRELRRGQLRRVVELLTHLPAGDQARPVVLRCQRCKSGCFELTVRFVARWNEGQMTQSWLAASVPLTPTEVELFDKL